MCYCAVIHWFDQIRMETPNEPLYNPTSSPLILAVPEILSSENNTMYIEHLLFPMNSILGLSYDSKNSVYMLYHILAH